MPLQRRQRALQRRLAVLVPEELGVRQPGAQHALVAGDDGRAAVRRLDVGDDDEARRELARRASSQREIFLVRAHGGGQHLGRQRHEALVDAAHQRDRPFDQARHLVEQRRVGR